MKRTPLKRGKRLRSGKPVARGPHGLPRTTTLNARRTPKAFRQRRDPQYAAYVRAQRCILWNRVTDVDRPWAGTTHSYHVCTGRVQACHVTSRGAGGDDRANLYPGCPQAHFEQHYGGIETWQRRWGVDLKAEAARLYELYQRETGAP